MASLVSTIVESYDDIMENKGDPRVKDWLMMSSPFPTLFICLGYAYFAKSLGPKLMENRKPFKLRKTLLVYNLLQVFLSSYLFYEGGMSGWFGKYSFRCQPVDYSYSPVAMRMARGCWMYYMSKFVELLDTVFFILRKKNNQVSTLHVIHHGLMPLSVWFGVKFTAGGHSSFFGLLNTFVHIWMYLYYFLSALGPKIQPYLWWKKYLTTMQMIQFVAVLIHQLQVLFIDCDYPKAIVWWIAFHAVLFLFLFKNFYDNAYRKKEKGDVDVSRISVDPDREGIKQSDLWAHNYEHLAKKRRENAAKMGQAPLYADQYKMATGYISDEGLRNRVFINKNSGVDE